MKIFNQLAQNSTYVTIARLIDMLLGLLVLAMIARFLGPAGFGQFAFVMAFVVVPNALVNLGMNSILVREISKDPEQAAGYLGSGVILKIFLAIIFFPSAFLVAFIFKIEPLTFQSICIFLVAIAIREILSVTASSAFVAFEKLNYELLVTVVFQVVCLSLVFFTCQKNLDLRAFLLAFLIADLLRGLISVAIVQFKLGGYSFSNSSKRIKFLFYQSLPLSISHFFNISYTKVDAFVLKGLSGNWAVGQFDAAYRPITYVFTLFGAVGQIFLPLLTRINLNKPKEFTATCNLMLLNVLTFIPPICLVLTIFAKDIILLFFGESYLPAVLCFQIVVWSILLRSLDILLGLIFIARHQQRWITLGTGLSLMINLAIDILLIPKYGPLGAAFGTICGDISSCLLMFVVLSKHLSNLQKTILEQDASPFLKDIMKPILAALPIVALLYFFSQYWIWILAFMIWGFLIYSQGLISKSRILWLMQLAKSSEINKNIS